MMKALLIGLATTLITFSGMAAADQAAQTAKEKAALTAAEAWLILIDEENYQSSWSSAAEHFKASVEQSQWINLMQAARSQVGKRLSRDLQSKQYRTSLPGAPDGEYVVLQFKTVFEHKQTATETITPMLDADGNWRVSGYYIK